ncbi:hypothetical protein R69658_07913 [Paraburkholderia aspalathi]|uniref:Uncharacterized protein n=1 Tax=Paraburkholderia aspalathi TaxID=1324617 RepID=A0ABM8T888_9BURK|nr:DUF6065 family protein [Paraburkholderia aspalathi]MBK3824164.1 hypothetical protein [Paraburkholderia aspalathi]MBK3836008.1 hypothetical protein [Paraburkholderia aspalathi]MBK3865776.1 hypothetical protein [Paraburkholderia aspalathi]CAE6866898.1 hypothetical protein R69658_07913 [Paraburkholderia aspalathi]
MRIAYRKIYDVLEPRRTRLEVPGWSGEATHEVPQPWHCKPFTDAGTYGLELRFSWKTPCQVSLKRGHPEWTGDLSAELPPNAPSDWHPFSVFSPGFFGFSPLLDLQVPDGMGLFVLPHPRCLMDTSRTAPIAIPGIIETHWWPRPFFLVFKAPTARQRIKFKYGDPIAQLVVVPLNENYELEEMSTELAVLRNRRALTLASSGAVFSNKIVEYQEGYPSFNNKYKALCQQARTKGVGHVATLLDETVDSGDQARKRRSKKSSATALNKK